MISEIGIYAITAVIAFFAVYFLEKPLIPFLTRLKVGNTEREELKSHQVKNGTPSMGGIGIIGGMIIACVPALIIWFSAGGPKEHNVIQLLVMVGLITMYGVTGFADDFIKTVKHRSDGLIAWQKMLILIVITVLFMIFIQKTDPTLITEAEIPFAGGTIHLGVFGYPVFFLAVLGTINGVNFTDGVDGLASSVTVPVALFFAVIAIACANEPVGLLCFACAGALMGFLMHNAHPAKIFMGDTGSLALGGFVAVIAYMTGSIAFVLIVGLIYWIEILSVMLQVGYFKLTKGKRIFRMAPIHHHFELGGMSETQVVNAFTCVTVLLCIIGLWGYFG